MPKNDLYKMIHLAQTDDDIGLIVNVIKKYMTKQKKIHQFSNLTWSVIKFLKYFKDEKLLGRSGKFHKHTVRFALHARKDR